MSITKIFLVLTLLVCLSAANIVAQVYSGVDENDLTEFSAQQPIDADKADSRTKSLARIDLPKQKPTETKFVTGQHLRVPVKIVYNGRVFKTLFVLDTGATQTSVTPIFAEILGVSDIRQGRWVKVSRIKAGPLELKDHRIAIWDTPDNLIGMDLLQYVNFTINYQAGVIRWNL